MYTYSVSHPSNTLHIYHTSVYRFVFNFFFRFLFNSLSLITTKWSDIWEHDETWSVHVYNYARATFSVLFFEVEGGGGERGWMGCVFIYNISDCITCFRIISGCTHLVMVIRFKPLLDWSHRSSIIEKTHRNPMHGLSRKKVSLGIAFVWSERWLQKK